MHMVDVWKIEHQTYGSLNIYISVTSKESQVTDEDRVSQNLQNSY